jgi:hypothetical protein
MMSVDSWDDPHDLVHVDDHHGLVQVIRNSYRRIHRTRLRSAVSFEPVIKGKRRYPRSLVTRNYEPLEHALHTAVVSQMPLLDLFGLARG